MKTKQTHQAVEQCSTLLVSDFSSEKEEEKSIIMDLALLKCLRENIPFTPENLEQAITFYKDMPKHKRLLIELNIANKILFKNIKQKILSNKKFNLF